jgi:thioesterase domain-containing protein
MKMRSSRYFVCRRAGYRWRKFAAQAEVVEIVGTHNTMTHAAYVDGMAKDLLERIDTLFGAGFAR